MHPRYVVAVWHGESRSVAYVMDNHTEDCLASYDTDRNGVQWLDRATALALRWNNA